MKTTHYNHVIAVYTRRDRRTRQSTAHKLQQRHLRTGILHRHAIGLQLQIRLSPDVLAIICI